MTGKSTLALLAAFGALTAYVLFYEAGEGTSEDAAKASKLLVPGVKAADVRGIKILRPRDAADAPVVIARAEGKDALEGKGKWRITAPVSAAADPTEVDGALSTIEFLEKKAALPGADAKAVGLETPRLKVEIERASGTTAIEIGEDDPVAGKQVYARVAGSPEVFAIDASAFGRLDRRANDFRDRAILTLDRWQVSRASLAGEGGKPALSFKKDGDHWVMDAPETDFADRVKVEDLVRVASEARAKDFVAEPADAAALEASGLARPRFTVTLEAGAEKQSLEVGAALTATADVHARRAGAALVVTVDETLAKQLNLDPEHWRSASVLPPSGDRIEALEVRRADQPAPEARLVREASGDGWAFAAPRTATADAEAVAGLLSAIRDLTVIATPAKTVDDPANFGLDDRRALVVTIETAKEKRSFRLGKASARESGWYVQREGRTSVQETIFEKAPLVIDARTALRDRTLLGRPASEVARIDVSRAKGAGRAYVHLPDGRWSTHEAKADDAALSELAEGLATLRAERIIGAPADLTGTGLQAPWLTATVTWRDAAEAPAVIALGKVLPEGSTFHARLTRGDESIVFAVPKALVDALDADHVAAPEAPKGAGDAPPASGPPAAPATASPTSAPEGPG